MSKPTKLHPRRQLAVVIDLNKCIGCHTCTMACKTQWTNRNGRDYMYWNNVESQPGQGYPRAYPKMGGGFNAAGKPKPGVRPSAEDYGIPWEYDLGRLISGGEQPWIQPDHSPDGGANWDEDQGAGEHPNSYYFYLPRMCNHCKNPACLKACPRKSIYKRAEDGIVLVDQDRCRGYRFCVEACPYKKAYFNRKVERTEKCLFCYPRVEKGLAPACARQCVGRIRSVGYRDDKNGRIYKLVDHFKVALPLHAEWGTQPNVFYIPPLSPSAFDAEGRIAATPRIPTEYLESLFGPRVKEALGILQEERRKKASGAGSELMDLLIGFEHAKLFEITAASKLS